MAEPGTPDRRRSALVAAPGLELRRGHLRPASAGGYEAEVAAYLQARLLLFVRVLWWLSGASYLVNLALWATDHAWSWSLLVEGDMLAQAAGWVGTGGVWIALRRPGLPRAALQAADALVLWGYGAVFLLVYHATYGEGGGRGVPFLAVLLVTRAVIVPSTAARTTFLCVPLLAALLGVQVAHGAVGGSIPAPEGPAAAAPLSASWWVTALWDQVFLGIATATAAVASRVTFRLRLQAYEAKQVDQYVLEAPIGAGAMGEIYRARHALMQRPVAVKFLRADIAGERTIHRFEEEVRQTSRLNHPNTIAIYDFGRTTDGAFYYAMELLDGADLARVLEATGPLAASRVIHLLAQACGALREAHEKGLVHRDVKPANLVLCERGLEQDVLKVMDFGLVKDTRGSSPALSEVGEIVGSAPTIAPECLDGSPAGPPADLYALAAVGCELLTGRPILDARTVPEFLLAHLREAPIAPSARVASVPKDLERVLLRSLSKAPADRHASAGALRDDLLRCADAGRWTQADAVAWWARHGADVRAGDA